MDQRLTIERDDIVALATELAELRRESVDDALMQVLLPAVEQERERKAARDERRRRIDQYLAEMHALLPNPRPSSNHDWLYDDETGLPI